MSSSAFLESSFGEELENTEIALKHFDQHDVSSLRELWRYRIESNEHRVIEFEGTPEIYA
jgi:hypothetical protein